MAAYRLRTSKQRSFFIIMDFYKILKSITADTNLTFGDILVMSVLVTHAQYADNKTVQLTVKEIHEEFTRLSIANIKRSLNRLSELHYIEIIKQRPYANKYHVLIDIGQAQSKAQSSKYTKHKKDIPVTDIEEYKSVINKFLQ